MLLEEVHNKNKVLQLNNELLINKLNDSKSKKHKTYETDKVLMSFNNGRDKKGIPNNKNKDEHNTITASNYVENKQITPRIEVKSVVDTVTSDLRVSGNAVNARFRRSASSDHDSNRSDLWVELESAQRKKMNEIINMGTENKNPETNILDDTWTTVVKKKPIKRNTVLCTGSKEVNSDSRVKGALKRKWLFVGRVCGQEVSEKDMNEFLKSSTH